MKMFPKDCRGCEDLISYDMSIDDWTNICKINHMWIDDCDEDYKSYRCPKEELLKHCVSAIGGR